MRRKWQKATVTGKSARDVAGETERMRLLIAELGENASTPMFQRDIGSAGPAKGVTARRKRAYQESAGMRHPAKSSAGAVLRRLLRHVKANIREHPRQCRDRFPMGAVKLKTLTAGAWPRTKRKP